MKSSLAGDTHNLHSEILRLGEHMTPPFSHRDQNGWNSAEYAHKLTEHAEIFTARNAEGKTIGLIAAYMNQPKHAFISMLVVSPEYRRCRIAQALCQNVHELARQRGICCVRGEIRRENAACRAMAVDQLGYTEQDIDGSEYVRVEKMLDCDMQSGSPEKTDDRQHIVHSLWNSVDSERGWHV